MNKQLLVGLAAVAVLGIVTGIYSVGGSSEPEPPLQVALAATFTDPVASPAKGARQEFHLLPADVQADRETPAITVDSRGRVLLAYASQTGTLERTLYLAHSSDGLTFDAPTAFRKVPIYKYAAGSGRKRSETKADAKPEPKPEAKAEGKGGSESSGGGMTYSTHVLPRLVSNGDEITLGWVEAVNGGPKVVYYVARSSDGGKTFSEPIATHSANASKPGFTALTAAANGEVEASWLDNGKPVVAVKRPGSDGFEAETVAYPGPPAGGGVCPCCDTAVIHPEKGPLLVAFRNNDGDRRDIWIAPAGDNGFKPATPIGKHLWSFKGCPHDGPSLANVGGRVQVAFMDAHTGVNRVYFADSDVAPLAFDPREVSPGSKGSQGHPRLVPQGPALLAIWDESLDPAAPAPPAPAKTEKAAGDHSSHHAAASMSGTGRAVRIASSSDGKAFHSSIAVAPRPGAFQLNPAAVALPNGDAIVTWNELDTDGKHIVVTRVPAQLIGK